MYISVLIPHCLQAMLDEMGCKLTEHEWPDWWYFGEEKRLLHAPEEVQRFLNFNNKETTQMVFFIQFAHSTPFQERDLRSWPFNLLFGHYPVADRRGRGATI